MHSLAALPSLSPVVSSSGLAKNEVVGTEKLAKGASAHTVHGAGLKVHQHRTGYIPSTCGLIVVHVDALQLQVTVAMVSASGIDAVLIRDDLKLHVATSRQDS